MMFVGRYGYEVMEVARSRNRKVEEYGNGIRQRCEIEEFGPSIRDLNYVTIHSYEYRYATILGIIARGPINK
jgi:hypothetical protein